MVLNIIPVLRSKTIEEATRLVDCVQNFVTNDGLVTVIKGYDVNNSMYDGQLNILIQGYDGLPDVNDQVDLWLASAP